MPVPVSMSMRPVLAGSDLLVIARDITEQRLAQATLAEVETRLEAGEALAHMGSWLWDVRTGTVQLSAEFYRIHGIQPLEFDGTFDSYLGLVAPLDRERVRAAMRGSVASGHPFEDTYRVVRPDGQVRVVQVRAQPTLGSAGAAMGLRGIGHDVTERSGTPEPGAGTGQEAERVQRSPTSRLTRATRSPVSLAGRRPSLMDASSRSVPATWNLAAETASANQ